MGAEDYLMRAVTEYRDGLRNAASWQGWSIDLRTSTLWIVPLKAGKGLLTVTNAILLRKTEPSA